MKIWMLFLVCCFVAGCAGARRDRERSIGLLIASTAVAAALYSGRFV